MTTILGIAGSARNGSFNAALCRAAAESAPADVRVEVATIRGIPLYDGDVEAESGIPEAVPETPCQRTRSRAAASFTSG